MEWKWTKGESYERSLRIKNKNKKNEDDLEDFRTTVEKTAYSSSLNYDENTWDILNQTNATNGFKISNKREDLDLKISDRELVQQCGFNPFLTNDTYVEDISIRDKFLKPINTTSDRIKSTDVN
jgi:hypothetical protein